MGDFVKLQFGSRRFHVTLPSSIVSLFGWCVGDVLSVHSDCIPEFNGDCIVLYKGKRFVGQVLS